MVSPQFRPSLAGMSVRGATVSGIGAPWTRGDSDRRAAGSFLASERAARWCNGPAPVAAVPAAFYQVTSLATFALFLFTQGRRFHVWHIHQYGSHAVLAVVLGKLLHRPVVLKLTNTKDYGIQQVIADLPLAGLSRALLLGIDAVVATTQETRAEAEVFGIQADHVYVVGNGIDTEIFHPRRHDERLGLRRQLSVDADGMVVFVGRLSKEKNLDGSVYALGGWHCRI